MTRNLRGPVTRNCPRPASVPASVPHMHLFFPLAASLQPHLHLLHCLASVPDSLVRSARDIWSPPSSHKLQFFFMRPFTYQRAYLPSRQPRSRQALGYRAAAESLLPFPSIRSIYRRRSLCHLRLALCSCLQIWSSRIFWLGGGSV